MLFHFVSWLVKSTERRFLDREAIFIANSAEVKNRILKYWGVESEVIHPPVDVSFFSQYLQPKGPENVSLISAGRFVPYKKLEQVIELARLAGLPLILAGSGTSGAKVHFEISPSREKLAELISHSSVYLHLAHEDFGILPIEAMATGTPVLGYALGGLLETVNSRNGFLVNEFSQLNDGIDVCLNRNRIAVAASVQGYSEENFKRNIAMSILKRWPELTPEIKEELLLDC
jgi:glycosyltransferase involved in cell wall biosynthesis